MQCSSRREFIKTAGAVTLGLVAVSGTAGAVFSCASPTPTEVPTKVPSPTATSNPAALSVAQLPAAGVVAHPWPLKKIDVTAAAERAYAAYYNGGCMYGAFEGIVGEMREKYGPPFDAFPAAMMKYGGAGVSGWGTLCGALNGAAAAIALVTEQKVTNPIINEVYGWYGVTPLPDYKPAKPKFANLDTSVAASQLCHISVTKWCDKTKFKALSPERAERCAWLTASVVRYTADLLNKQAEGTFKATFVVPASVTGCLSCHGKGGPVENVHVSNQTVCTECHDNLGSGHPGTSK